MPLNSSSIGADMDKKTSRQRRAAKTRARIDRQKVGQVAAEIRAYKSPEPSKGKGVRYSDEKVVIKETKKK
jgi:hypothetical protein